MLRRRGRRERLPAEIELGVVRQPIGLRVDDHVVLTGVGVPYPEL